jgi:hypothetical protein
MNNGQTEQLLERAARSAALARDLLLDSLRGRLRRMGAVRFDPRLAARIDPSDVVQETLAEAVVQLDRYLRERPLPFCPWLRQLGQRRQIDLHRRHLQARRRTFTRVASAVTVQVGQSITFRPPVSGGTRAGTPTGTHKFLVGNVVVAQVKLDASGQASVTTHFTTKGKVTLCAVYSGDNTFAPSSNSVIESIT